MSSIFVSCSATMSGAAVASQSRRCGRRTFKELTFHVAIFMACPLCLTAGDRLPPHLEAVLRGNLRDVDRFIGKRAEVKRSLQHARERAAADAFEFGVEFRPRMLLLRCVARHAAVQLMETAFAEQHDVFPMLAGQRTLIEIERDQTAAA